MSRRSPGERLRLVRCVQLPDPDRTQGPAHARMGDGEVAVLHRRDLRKLFAKPDGATERIGVEVECGVVDPETGLTTPYAGPRGVAAVLQRILQEWDGQGQYDGPHLTGVRLADGTLISVEHGGQLEYSSAPAGDLATVVEAMRAMLERLSEIARRFGLALLPGANLPFNRIENASWVPTLRGPVVRDFFNRVGGAGSLLLSTSTQTTLDYLSERDLADKLRMQTAASTVVAAMLVNSPLYGGSADGLLSHRSQHWQCADPRRWGVLRPALREQMDIEDFIDWAVRLPMVFRRDRSGAYRPGPELPFAALMQRGFDDGAPATWDDWVAHLAQIWTTVRLRETLELRAADGPPYQHIPAVPALWVGLSYHPESRQAAWQLLRHYTARHHQATLRSLAAAGLSANLGGDSVRELAGELLRLARAGLQARVAARREHPRVLRYLDPLEEVVASGETFAEQCMRRWEREFARHPSRYVAAYRI